MDLSCCDICPRACHADRLAGALGLCGQGAAAKAARASLHVWEEPPISGWQGSGTVFFSGCTLRCVYCQNAAISRDGAGIELVQGRLAEVFLAQQERGAHNLNLVTPTQFTPQIIEAVHEARAQGLSIPIVWNTSGYERVETLLDLEGIADIYLTDFKYTSSKLAWRYSAAADYPAVAEAALDEMMRQCPACIYGEDGLMRSGVIVRHMLLPGCLADSFALIRLLSSKPYARNFRLSLMSQYTPMPHVAETHPELAEPVDEDDYWALVDYAQAYGFDDIFVQEEGSVGESFIPAFDGTGL